MAARTPIRPTERPLFAKNIGNSPQARPSLRLFTSPACEAADNDFSLKLVIEKIAWVVREGSGEEVGCRFDDAERGDERQRCRDRGQSEFFSGEQGENGSLLADHPSNESVDSDEQRELSQVRLQTEANSAFRQ